MDRIVLEQLKVLCLEFFGQVVSGQLRLKRRGPGYLDSDDREELAWSSLNISSWWSILELSCSSASWGLGVRLIISYVVFIS